MSEGFEDGSARLESIKARRSDLAPRILVRRHEIHKAERAAYRDARKTGRLEHPNRFRTISGQVVAYDNVPKRQPAWVQIVTPQPKVLRNRPPSDFAVEVPAQEKENLAPFTGMNRVERRAKMHHTGLLGGYTKGLHTTFGRAWSDNLEAKRLMRANAASARLAQKYLRVSEYVDEQ